EPTSEGSSFYWHSAASRAAHGTGWNHLRGTTRILHCSPDDRMSIAASEEDDSAALPSSGGSAILDTDPEMVAMLAMLG
ncbi:hypothetical protein M9458_018259, partial [Cirrhinus mrigala]